MSYSIRWDIAKLVKAQDFDSCTTLVRIQLSQPTQRARRMACPLCWLGYKCDRACAVRKRWFAFPPKADGSLLTRGSARNHGAQRSYPAIPKFVFTKGTPNGVPFVLAGILSEAGTRSVTEGACATLK